MSQYGIFGDVVANAGALMATVGAIGLAWRGGARWGLESVSVEGGSERVGLLLAALGIVILWLAPLITSDHFAWRLQAMLWAGAACLAGLVVYSALRRIYVFDQDRAVQGEGGTPTTIQRKVIGGLWLTPHARAARRTNQVSVQILLKGAANDLDTIWPRPARAIAETLFMVGYLMLTMGGTIALAAASLLIGARMT